MKRWISLLALSLMLAACGTKDYGDAPGFRNGKPTHPLVKLGKPYDIGGTTYYPEYDPEYSETGMASWYGPGFHGKSTANGEQFNKYEMTAAHRTLPIPSIVKVTNIENGRTAIVRINDRGPFAHGRIIDLSKAAADRLDMIRSGVAKVKVEYLPTESRRYVSLLESGRMPSNINVERDVLMGGGTSFADASKTYHTQEQQQKSSWFERINPISSAQAAEPKAPAGEVVAVETRTTSELPPLDTPAPSALPAPVANRVEGTTNVNTRSPFDLIPQQRPVIEDPRKDVVEIPPPLTPSTAGTAHGYVVQLGVFANEANALHLKERFADVGPVNVTRIDGNRTLYRVRLGPFADEATANAKRTQAINQGVRDAKVLKQ